MTQMLTRIGEEYFWKFGFRQDLITRDSPEQIQMGVYDESTDNIGADETQDYDGSSGDITTEPTDGQYSKQTLDLDTSDIDLLVDAGDYFADVADHVFNMSNTTGSADHWFMLARFQSDVAGDSSQNWHLIAVGPLEKDYDLNSLDQLTNDQAGIKLN